MLFLFKPIFRWGDLTIIDAGGKPHRFGGPPIPGLAPSTIRLHDRSLHWKLPLHPRLIAGEAFMDGTLTVEHGGLYDFLALTGENIERWERARHKGGGFDVIDRLNAFSRHLHHFNPIRRARRNVAHHYDLSDRLYDLFLDADRQYSCAYFAKPGHDLEQAQQAKKRHIIAKLRLEPGQHVIDIGSGWGGLALEMANTADVRVTGITLSAEQLKIARDRAERAGLSDRVRFELMDYRQMTGGFDRIVSVGMFEHVGPHHYRTFFDQLYRLLSEDGLILLHAIGRSEGPGATNAWIRKYIFPGGYSPALSEVLPAVENARLLVSDIEILRHHYADTLRHWRHRFDAHRGIVSELYDERFCRMWEFYLAGCEMNFRHQNGFVFQIQMVKNAAAAPRTRDYIYEYEHGLKQEAAE